MSRSKKYVDLKTNGKLFPTFIVANFKQYKLPEIVKTDGDPCSRKVKQELRKYQIFLGKYLSYDSPYRTILIYHGLGSGKTASAINIYNVLYNSNPNWNVFILIKASLKDDPWLKDLRRWLENENRTNRENNIKFISYDSPIADKAFFEVIRSSDVSKKSMYIIDEAHNFIRNVHGNIVGEGKRALNIYNHMIQNLIDEPDTRIVLLSGTPAINSPFELALMFNLLRPNIFPKNETEFMQEFVSTEGFRRLIPARKNLFQRRIMGLVSYYIGSTPDVFATKTVKFVEVPMSRYQEDIYNFFEQQEEEMARRKKNQNKSSETYKSYTRQACNFVFPNLGVGMSGDSRPRPSQYRIKLADAQKFQEGRTKEIGEETNFADIQNYADAITEYVTRFDRYLSELKGDINDDINKFKNKYNYNYEEFHEKEKHSQLYNELHRCSAKFVRAIFNILMSPGPVLVYSNYVLVEGLQIFKIYLKYFGFTQLTPENSKEFSPKYTEYHGGIRKEQRIENLNMFNQIENKTGEICRVIMISRAGAEGINLKNVRQVHLLEPFWHEVIMTQMIGRAIRMCSHQDLPMEDRHVDVFRYKSIRNKDSDTYIDKQTTDQYIEALSRGKEGLIQSFLDAIKEVAVDCVLNKSHNSLINDYQCFQFEEQTLFDKQIGPAYREDIRDDIKMDNGSNSVNSQTIRVKVVKINAVKQLDENGTKFSSPQKYWYNADSGTVYDFELHYPIGKVKFNEDGLPVKFDKDTYIIDRVIPIPMIKEIDA